MIILFLCLLQMSLSVQVYIQTGQKISLVLVLFSVAAVKGITIDTAKEHCLLIPGVFLCAFSSALSMPHWCVWLLNRSRFNHKREQDQAHEIQPYVLILNSRLFGLLNHAERMPDHASSKACSGYNCTAGFDLLPIGRGEESLLLQDKYRSGMWLQIQNS